jgi:hypothetical protein
MVRSHIYRNARIAPEFFIAAIFISLSLTGPAQTNTKPVPPPIAAPAPRVISELLQPSLDTVRQALQSLRIDKWKKGSIRDEASGNIDAIQRDLRANLPSLLQDADAAPGTVSKLLPISRHVDALYDVLLRVTEASRVVGPDDQAAQLQKALLSLGNARLALDDRLQGSAGALEKQVVDLRANIETEAARRASEPAPVALPCVPQPPVHKAVKKRVPAAKPAAKPSATATPSATSPNTTPGTQPATSH